MMTTRFQSINEGESSELGGAGVGTPGVWGEQFSIYLDLVRFLSAAYVMLAHTKYPRFTDGWLNFAGNFANDAVMIFFVLSGLVIAHVTFEKERSLGDYVRARLSRLWSVALPALAVTLLADSVGRQLQPSLYDGAWFAADQPIWRLLCNAVFIGEVWYLDFLPFSNVPYWSINYEFWYYAIFGAFVFSTGYWRFLTLGICGLICGPKILLLLPVWLLGVATHILVERGRGSMAKGLLLAVLPLVTYALYSQSGIHGHLGWVVSKWVGAGFRAEQLSWSKNFLSNYVVGFLVASHFYGMAVLLNASPIFGSAAARVIRVIAGYTFSIYLLHVPLLHFSAALIQIDPSAKADWLLMVAVTALLIVLIGSVSEHKKHVAKKIILQSQACLGRLLRPLVRSA